MPDASGRLTPEDRNLVMHWLQSKGRNHDCPVCKTNRWMIGDHLVNGLVHAPDSRLPPRENYPQVVLVCSHCAYTRYFMAVPMGLARAIDLGPPRKG